MSVEPRSEAVSGPEVLGVLLTSKCNIVCRHCCNDSHPFHTGAVRFEDIAHLIEMARDVPSIKEIGISGGEPFLFIPLLHRVIQFAASLGFTSSITTNGFWAKSSSSASRLLGELKASGLRAINISTSVFHQEFLDLRTVVNAANIALSVGLKVAINLVSTPSLSRDELQAALDDLCERVEIIVMPCAATGRGATSVHQDEFTHEFVIPHSNCREHFKKLAVDGLGNIYPCCSPGGFTTPLLMGNVKDCSLRSILEMSTHNKLLAILESVGPQFFLTFLRAAALEPALPDKFSDQCHLCNVMLSSKNYTETIMKASEQLFSELITLAPPESPVSGGRLSKLIEQLTSSIDNDR